MFVTIAYNEYGPRNIDAAKDTLADIRVAFPDTNVFAAFEPVPLAGNHDKTWVEVGIDFMGTNADASRKLVAELTAAGFDARTVHRDD